MHAQSKAPIHETGETVSYCGYSYILIDFLGYKIQRDGRYISLKRNFRTNQIVEVWRARRENSTEGDEKIIRIAIDDNRPHNFFKKDDDETSLDQRNEELFDRPDSITCSLEEYLHCRYNFRERSAKQDQDEKDRINNNMFYLQVYTNLSKQRKVLAPSTNKAKRLFLLEILAFMKFQQRTYPTVQGFNTIKGFVSQYPHIKEELDQITLAQKSTWVHRDTYKKQKNEATL